MLVTFPFASICKQLLPDAADWPERIKFVVLAVVAVIMVVDAYAICEVEDACSPDVNQIAVDVEFTPTPKLLFGENGNA